MIQERQTCKVQTIDTGPSGWVSTTLLDLEKVVTFPYELRNISSSTRNYGAGGGKGEVFIKIICIFKFHYSWALGTCCPAGASAMWQTQAQGQPPAVSQTIGNHSTLNFSVSCHPPWLLTTPRAPSGAANFPPVPPLTCENFWRPVRWLMSKHKAICRAFDGLTSDSWERSARGRTAAGCCSVDPLIWLILAALRGCCQWASQGEGGWTAEQWRSLSQLENHFLKTSRRHQLVLAADIWSGECRAADAKVRLSKPLPLQAGYGTACLFTFLSTPWKKGLGESSLLNFLYAEWVTWASAAPTHFSLGSQRNWR